MVYNVCRVISDIRAYCSVMSLTLTFAIPNLRRVKDPVQYDKERNEARRFKTPIKSKSKKVNRIERGVIYDPDQYDIDTIFQEEGMKRVRV